MSPDLNPFRRSLMGRSFSARLAGIGLVLALLWLAIAWAVNLP